MKIAYLIGTLATQGGTAKMVTEKANYIVKNFGYDVSIITMVQDLHDSNTYELASGVKQVNLALPIHSQYKYNYPKRLWAKWHMYRLTSKKANEIVNSINPDILIGVGQYNADIICRIKCRAKKIIECHEARSYSLSITEFNLSFLKKIFLGIYRFLYFRTIERKADAIATLTDKDKLLWKRAKYVEVIPNFSKMEVSKYSNCTNKQVIAVGRLEWEKGYERLLDIWKIVSPQHKDWRLVIFGEGRLKKSLETIIRNNSINNITIQNFTRNISQEYSNSSICVSTSRYEGFSLVILEAMKHGVPCIAFDCPFGPGSIIQDNLNGFLIKDGDIKQFAERLCYLIENTNIRKDLSNEAIKRAATFDIDVIMNKWKNLFENVL